MNISKNIQGYPVKCAGVRKNKRINSACIMCDIFDIKKYYTNRHGGFQASINA